MRSRRPKKHSRPLGLGFASALKTVVYPKPSFEITPSLPEHTYRRRQGCSRNQENNILTASKSLPVRGRTVTIDSTMGSRTLVGSRPETMRPRSYARPLGESRSENQAIVPACSDSKTERRGLKQHSTHKPDPDTHSQPARRRSFPSSRKSTTIPQSRSGDTNHSRSNQDLIDDAPDPRLVDSFGRRRKTIAHSSSQMVLDGSFPVDLSPIIEDTSVFPPLTSNAQDPPVEKPVVPPKSGLRRVVARKMINDTPDPQDDEPLHEDPSIPALLLTFPTPELPHSPILAPQLPFRLPSFEDDIRPDSQALARDDQRPPASDATNKHAEEHSSPSHRSDTSIHTAHQDPILNQIVHELVYHQPPSEPTSPRHLLSPDSAPPSPPRCTNCGFGFGYSLALADISSPSLNRSRTSLDVKRSSSRTHLADSGNRINASSSSVASFNSAASSVVPLKTEPCEVCAPQWTACKDWYAARGRRLREPASQNAKAKLQPKKLRWMGWDGRRGEKKATEEPSVEHKSQWFSDSIKKSRSVNEFGVMGRPWRSVGQTATSAPAATTHAHRDAMLGDSLKLEDLGRSTSMDLKKPQRTSAQSDASVLRRIRRLFVTGSRSSQLSAGRGGWV